jgi:DNA polymerase III subunit delta
MRKSATPKASPIKSARASPQRSRRGRNNRAASARSTAGNGETGAVEIRKGDAERFVEAPPPQFFLFLVHGADAGLVRERALRLAKARVDDRHDPFQFVEMSGDAVAGDPLTLLDEANTIPLFGGRRALLVESGAKSILPTIESLLAAPPQDCSVIVTAGALKRDAPLRKIVEGAKAGAAIECQPDSEQDIAALIDKTLKEAKLAASDEARALLLAALGEDRLMSRSELDKLVLYMHGRGKIEAEDVETIVAYASNIATDKVVLDAFSGDMSAAGARFDAALAQGADATQLIVTALRYAQGLHRGRLAADAEGRPDAGTLALKRAGFFSVDPRVLNAHLRNWPTRRIGALIEPLRQAQTRARAHADIARMEAARTLLIIARDARRR